LRGASDVCILSKTRSMRKILLSIAPLLITVFLSAQGVFSNKTQSVLEKVIQDYPNRFTHIKGEQIQQTGQTTEYRSTVQLQGSSPGVITLNNTGSSDEDSWTCAVSEAEGFEQAKDKYHEVFAQIRNSIITSGQKTFILTGQYEDPSSDKKCSHVVFSLLPGVGEMKKVKVELSLREEAKAWKITLRVYDSDLKETQGAVTAN